LARYLNRRNEALFPNLQREDYHVIGRATARFNCIAHAAGDSERPWWPVEEGDDRAFWPNEIAREESVEAFLAAFATLGYVTCTGPELEPGFDKLAIYADPNGRPKHAAKQTLSGFWSSKLGSLQTIEHRTLEALEGDSYGRAVAFLKRRSE